MFVAEAVNTAGGFASAVWNRQASQGTRLAATLWKGAKDQTLRAYVESRFKDKTLGLKAEALAADLDAWLRECGDADSASKFMRKAQLVVSEAIRTSAQIATVGAELHALCNDLQTNVKDRCHGSVQLVLSQARGANVGEAFLKWLLEVINFTEMRDEAEIQYIHFLTLIAVASWLLSKTIMSSEAWQKASVKQVALSLVDAWDTVKRTAPYWLKVISTATAEGLDELAKATLDVFVHPTMQQKVLSFVGLSGLPFAALLLKIMEKYSREISAAITDYHYNRAARGALKAFLDFYTPAEEGLRELVQRENLNSPKLLYWAEYVVDALANRFRGDSRLLRQASKELQRATESTSEQFRAAAAQIAAAPRAPPPAQPPHAPPPVDEVLSPWDALIRGHEVEKTRSPSSAPTLRAESRRLLMQTRASRPDDFDKAVLHRKRDYLKQCPEGAQGEWCAARASQLEEFDEATMETRPPLHAVDDGPFIQGILVARCGNSGAAERCKEARRVLQKFHDDLFTRRSSTTETLDAQWENECYKTVAHRESESERCEELRIRSAGVARSSAQPTPGRLEALRKQIGIFCAASDPSSAKKCQYSEAQLDAELHKMGALDRLTLHREQEEHLRTQCDRPGATTDAWCIAAASLVSATPATWEASTNWPLAQKTQSSADVSKHCTHVAQAQSLWGGAQQSLLRCAAARRAALRPAAAPLEINETPEAASPVGQQIHDPVDAQQFHDTEEEASHAQQERHDSSAGQPFHDAKEE